MTQKNFSNLLITSLSVVIILAMIQMWINHSTEKKPKPKKEPEIGYVTYYYHIKIYEGSQWDIIRANDSIFIAVPGKNASNDAVPVLFNLADLPQDYTIYKIK